jgi:glycine/D-amino acid oxidase-like deaminating enzyme
MAQPDPQSLSAALWAHRTPAFGRGLSLRGRVTADVVIVGAGYSGLSAALHLAKLGYEVAVIEADRPGGGASGRNAAGWIPAYLDRTPDDVEGLLGEAAGRALNMMIAEGARLVPALIEAHGMAADMRRSGILVASGAPKEAAGLRALAASWNMRGGHVDFVDHAEVRRITGSCRFSQGLFYRDAGTLNPFAYATGLAEAACDAGAAIYCGQAAIGVDRDVQGWRVRTPAGELMASHILIATEGYEANATLWPGLERCCYHVPMAMIASEPAPAVAARMMPAGIPVSDTNKSNPFWSMADADGRIVASLLPPRRYGVSAAEVARPYEAKLRRLYGDVPALRWSHFWVGTVAISAERIPRLLSLAPGVHAIGGFSGQGIGAATAAGREYARLIDADGDPGACRLPILEPRPLPMRRAIPFLVRHVVAPLGRATDRLYRRASSPSPFPSQEN